MGRAFTELLLLLRLLTTITTSVCCVPVHMVSTKRLIPNATNKPVVFVRGAATVHHHDQKHQVAMSGTLAENALGVGPSSKGRPPLSNEEPTEIEHQEWDQIKFWIVGAKTSKSFKKSRAARAKDNRLDHRYP